MLTGQRFKPFELHQSFSAYKSSLPNASLLRFRPLSCYPQRQLDAMHGAISKLQRERASLQDFSSNAETKAAEAAKRRSAKKERENAARTIQKHYRRHYQKKVMAHFCMGPLPFLLLGILSCAFAL